MSRFGRFQEEDETMLSDSEDITVGDLNLGDDEDDEKDPVGLPGYMEDRMSEEDLEMMDSGDYSSDEDDDDFKLPEEGDFETFKVSDEKLEEASGPIEPQPDEHISANAVDLGTMGSDTSDHQNDYDPKDVELLLKLMAYEADAMNEYLQAAKDTNNDTLRRLFADIGNEERFHMEQLLYAKCEETGEKYEPKDPDVKSEYEELLKMGMDEETAMQTAVDKCHIRGISVEDAKEEAVEIKEDTETLEQCMENFGFVFDRVMEAVDATCFNQAEYDKANDAFLEYYLMAEGAYIGADNGGDPGNGGINANKHPLRALRKIIGSLIDLIQKLLNKIKKLITNLGNRSREIKRFLKRYSLSGIFKDGIKMYFYDLDNPAEVDDAINKWMALVCDVDEAACKQVGVKVNLMANKNQVARSPRLMINGNVEKGINLLNQVQLTRTKSLFPEDKQKQEVIADCLFGYTKEKGANGRSVNVMNTLEFVATNWTFVLKAADELAARLDDMIGDQNSPYYRKRVKYDQSVQALQVVLKTCKAVINGISADIATISKLNTALMEAAQKQDYDDINANPQLKQRADQYSRFKNQLN